MNFRATYADNQNNRGQDQVLRLVIVNLRLDQYANTRSTNHTVQQQRYAAHNRQWNDLDRCSQFTHAGEQNGENCRTADNPGTVNAGDRHYADVFAVRGVRRRAEETRDYRRQTVGKHRTMQARIANQIFFHDICRYHQVPDVFSDDHQRCWQDGQNGNPFKTRRVKRRQREPVGLRNRRSVHNAHHEGERITGQHPDQNRDNRHKTAEQYGTKDRYRQRYHRNDDGF